MIVISHSSKETINLGKNIAGLLKKGDILCLCGELGSGKTILVKGIASGLGINPRRIISPSFVLIREYKNKNKLPFYHFDLFRLKKSKDILNLGYEEYLYGDGITAVEWADRLRSLMPSDYLKIELEIMGRNKRKIKFISFGRRYKKIIEQLRNLR